MAKILEDEPIFGDDYRYLPVVGDSVTGDTPLFIKYNETGYIDIKPIEELFNVDESRKDILGREYDSSPKKYKVLCRSGWVAPQYVYRHETKKKVYRVEDEGMMVDCTEDHSLFNKDKDKIKPSQLTNDSELEYYEGGEVKCDCRPVEFIKEGIIRMLAEMVSDGRIDRVPVSILNATKNIQRTFLEWLDVEVEITKTCQAGINFLFNSVKNVK